MIKKCNSDEWKKAAVAYIGVQLDGENMMTVSFKVKCHENPCVVEMNRMPVCMHAVIF